MTQNRREFLKRTTGGAALLAAIPGIVSSCIPKENHIEEYSLLKNGNTLLFQGDSITDAHRNKKKQEPNDAGSFGNGYAFLAAAKLLNELPGKELTIYNRGISGNKVYQLAERWQEDCIDLKPALLSILIGINDYWHTLSHGYKGTAATYENDYRKLLSETKDKFPSIKLVICEPFCLPGTSAVDESWIEPLSKYREAALKLAGEFGARWVPFQKVFNEACNHAPATYWTPDGVHPSMAGSQLMAETWLRAISS